MEKAPLRGNASIPMSYPSTYQSVDDQLSNGQQIRTLSLSSDDDMIDITTTGTVSERSIHNEEHGISHCGVTFMGMQVSGDSDDIPGIGQYDDFHTIDWQRDIARDRMRHRYIIKRKQDSICDRIKGAHDAWSGWVCVLLVGLFTGAVAGVIDIGASWMSDLKFGICPQAFWLNREQCCWSSKETMFDDGNCSQVIQLIITVKP